MNDSTMSPASEPKSTTVVAVDTGGTFTDVLLLRKGTLRTLKLPSTPDDPARAVLTGIERIMDGNPCPLLLHGSTVATNALLERTGARVHLVTNRGFEDVAEIGRQNRPQLYALSGSRPPPLVRRDDRIGIEGRLDFQGEVVQPQDPEELASLSRRLEDAESVAVVLLHSYANPEHEEAVAGALEELDAPLSLSSQLLPEYREYERTSTTVVNAYVAPLMSRYLGRLDRRSGAETVRIMGSDGGSLPVRRAMDEAVRTILSGPAGGVVGAREWAERSGFSRILTLDMGGTSTDVSLCPEDLLHTRELEIGGQPVAIPVLDIHTVGAGGGSLARVDPGGALRVGPRSAGAEPGPICYGKGGTEVTVTDAHLWLGRLPPDAFLGGERELDREAIAEPLETVARTLEVGPDETALGIISVVNTAMERALRVISVERGFDPGELTLVAFGGAGGLHAAELTLRLGASRALVPPDPGLLSAYGMLAAPITRESSRTVLLESDAPGVDRRMEEHLSRLEDEAVERMRAEGAAPEEIRVERKVDARYRGQSFELRVPGDGWIEAFHRLHQERYGYARRDSCIEAVTLRAVARTPGPPLEPPRIPEAEGPPPTRSWTVLTPEGRVDVDRVRRGDLRAGHHLQGPVLVLEYSATTWVPPGWSLQVDEWGSLHLAPSS